VDQVNKSDQAGATQVNAPDQRSIISANAGQPPNDQQPHAKSDEQAEGVIPKATAMAEKAVDKALEKTTDVADTTIDKVADAALNVLHGGTGAGNVGQAKAAGSTLSSTYSKQEEVWRSTGQSSDRIGRMVNKATSAPAAFGAIAAIATAGAFLWYRRSSGSRPLMKWAEQHTETSSARKASPDSKLLDADAASLAGRGQAKGRTTSSFSDSRGTNLASGVGQTSSDILKSDNNATSSSTSTSRSSVPSSASTL
jgi:hypothetical protein